MRKHIKIRELKEEEVFAQELSDEELDAVYGGNAKVFGFCPFSWNNPEPMGCEMEHSRNVYGGSGFSNCAGAVESGSWCDLSNDACYFNVVVYKGMKDCTKAWR